ncbi:hypothetical protein [Halobacterium bonnevillei]|uniref:Uncharacterized protein n=1 Tax=Halobacterium bonnevillei TaxID=2692200 RepID=A0A6B0SEX2_9EURY|nr:hypothetical protein [Halobacterium bonnevillei]MXR19226.1 hypothetical protein [Halobacterium bonnevillei]
MIRVPSISVVLVIILVAGCAGLGTENPAEPPAATPTETTRTAHECDTFGTGGVAPLGETNTTVTTVGQANASLRTVVLERADHPFDVSDLEYVPRDEIDETGAVRNELERYDTWSANTTLYYFSPRNTTGLDEMHVVTDGGAVFIIYIGAC